MRTALLLVLFGVCSTTVLVALVASRKDTSNRFPETGAFIVWAGPNSAGFREGLLGICSGALIHERVFLTAGHCTGRGVRGVPPFVHIAVSFNSANAFDRSSWVPVTRLLIHPSLPEECLSAPGCDPTTVGVFPAGDPTRADLGLVILARPIRNMRPAVLARPGALTDPRVARLPMTVVGYGSTEPIPRESEPAPSMWDGIRRYRTSALRKSSMNTGEPGACQAMCVSVIRGRQRLSMIHEKHERRADWWPSSAMVELTAQTRTRGCASTRLQCTSGLPA